MSHHREICATKTPYVSLSEAQHMARRVRKATGIRSTPYLCQICGFWHTTSLNRKASRRARKAVQRELANTTTNTTKD